MKKSLLFTVMITFVVLACTLDGCGRNLSRDFKNLQIPVNNINYGIVKEYNPGSSAQSIIVTDLDGDNKKEIVYKTSDIVILENDWTLRVKCTAGASGVSDKTFISDINDDGKKEIVTTGCLWDENTGWWGSLYLKIFDARCNLLNEYLLPSFVQYMFYEDIDNDNKNEIVVKIDTDIWILDETIIQKCTDASLLDRLNASIPDYRKGQDEKLVIGKKSYNIPVNRRFDDDINGDGISEIIVLAPQPVSSVGYTMILIFDSDGNLLWNYKYPTWIVGAAIADLNNDGYKEIFIGAHIEAIITVFGKQPG